MAARKKKEWTIIFLVNSKNNLHSESIRIIRDIYATGSDPAVNFVIIYHGLPDHSFPRSLTGTLVYLARNTADFPKDTPVIKTAPGNGDLAGGTGLKTLLNSIRRRFPAKRYGFFYIGHGSAGETDIYNSMYAAKSVIVSSSWTEDKIRSVYSKEQNGWEIVSYNTYAEAGKGKVRILIIYARDRKEVKTLTYKRIADMLRGVFRKKIDFVCLDCCWGQQIENAYTFSRSTDCLIASADQMPGLGLEYTSFCREIKSRPGIRTEEIGNFIVAGNFIKNYDDYDNSDNPLFRRMGVSITSLTISEQKLDNIIYYFKKVTGIMYRDMELFYDIIRDARKSCLDYTYHQDPNRFGMYNIDIIWFFSNLLEFAFKKRVDSGFRAYVKELRHQLLQDSFRSCLSANYSRKNPGDTRYRSLGGYGISICFPETREQATASLLSDTEISFYKATGWKRLLGRYYSYQLPQSRK